MQQGGTVAVNVDLTEREPIKGSGIMRHTWHLGSRV